MSCFNVIFHWETMTVNDFRRIMFALGGTHSGTYFYSMNVLFYISNTANISYSWIRCDVYKYFPGHVCFLKNQNHKHPHHDTLFGLAIAQNIYQIHQFLQAYKRLQIFNVSLQLLGRWLCVLGFVASHLHCVRGCHPL